MWKKRHVFEEQSYPIPLVSDDGVQYLHHTFAGTVCQVNEFWITAVSRA
jgi:hypothetical protein